MADPASTTEPEPKKRRNAWKWVSALLALAVVGLVVWGLSIASDRDSAQDELASTQKELASTQQELDSKGKALDQAQTDLEEAQGPDGSVVVTAGGLAAGKAVYDDLKQQLGATEQDLADAEKALEEAGAQQEQAEKDAEAAKKKAEQAGNETEKAQAEAEQAKADAKAAESKTKIAGECARAYVAAIGVLFEGDDPSANADDVRKQVEAITDECRAALGGS